MRFNLSVAKFAARTGQRPTETVYMAIREDCREGRLVAQKVAGRWLIDALEAGLDVEGKITSNAIVKYVEPLEVRMASYEDTNTALLASMAVITEMLKAQQQTVAVNKAVTEVMELAHVPAFVDKYCVLAPMVDIPSLTLRKVYNAACEQDGVVARDWTNGVMPVLKDPEGMALTTAELRRNGKRATYVQGITLSAAGVVLLQ